MDELQINVIHEILKDYIKTGKISRIGVQKKREYNKGFLFLLDGFGRKEFRYLARKCEHIPSSKLIALYNPQPNTKMAYKQIFHQGQENISQIVRQCNKKVLLIDNRSELSGFSADYSKIERKTDENGMSILLKKQSKYDIIWLHIMNIDHASHSSENIREKVREFACAFDLLFPKLSENSFILLFGDHGPHDRPYTYKNNLSASAKRKISRQANRIRKQASRTNIVFLEK